MRCGIVPGMDTKAQERKEEATSTELQALLDKLTSTVHERLSTLTAPRAA